MLGESRLALRYAELAARCEYAHWDIPMRTEGYSAVLPTFKPYRMLARLLALRVGQALGENHYDQALADLRTGLALARWCAGPT